MAKLSLIEAMRRVKALPHPRDESKLMPAYLISHYLGFSPSVINKMLSGEIKTIRVDAAMVLSEKFNIDIDPAYISGGKRAGTPKTNFGLSKG